MRKLAIVLAFGSMVWPGWMRAQTTTRPSQTQAQAQSKELFLAYCASCHGALAKGDGPAASALKMRPPDLTTLAARNGSQFPEMKVLGAIKAGPGIPAHGSEVMPVWGPMFRELEGVRTEAEVQLKIYNLMQYIKAMQVKEK